jgi:hypothetical protein
VLLAVVSQPLARVPEHLGQQIDERQMLGQGDIHPTLGSADRNAGKPGTH